MLSSSSSNAAIIAIKSLKEKVKKLETERDELLRTTAEQTSHSDLEKKIRLLEQKLNEKECQIKLLESAQHLQEVDYLRRRLGENEDKTEERAELQMYRKMQKEQVRKEKAIELSVFDRAKSIHEMENLRERLNSALTMNHMITEKYHTLLRENQKLKEVQSASSNSEHSPAFVIQRNRTKYETSIKKVEDSCLKSSYPRNNTRNNKKYIGTEVIPEITSYKLCVPISDEGNIQKYPRQNTVDFHNSQMKHENPRRYHKADNISKPKQVCRRNKDRGSSLVQDSLPLRNNVIDKSIFKAHTKRRKQRSKPIRFRVRRRSVKNSNFRLAKKLGRFVPFVPCGPSSARSFSVIGAIQKAMRVKQLESDEKKVKNRKDEKVNIFSQERVDVVHPDNVEFSIKYDTAFQGSTDDIPRDITDKNIVVSTSQNAEETKVSDSVDSDITVSTFQNIEETKVADPVENPILVTYKNNQHNGIHDEALSFKKVELPKPESTAGKITNSDEMLAFEEVELPKTESTAGNVMNSDEILSFKKVELPKTESKAGNITNSDKVLAFAEVELPKTESTAGNVMNKTETNVKSSTVSEGTTSSSLATEFEILELQYQKLKRSLSENAEDEKLNQQLKDVAVEMKKKRNELYKFNLNNASW